MARSPQLPTSELVTLARLNSIARRCGRLSAYSAAIKFLAAPLALSAALLASPLNANALCRHPVKNKLKLADVVCDDQLHIVIAGDSFVKGVGDTLNGNEGGYVLRLQQRYPKAIIENVGVPGVTTDRLRSGFMKNLAKKNPGETRYKVDRADLIILDVGRNDYFDDTDPAITVRNIKRTVKYLRKELKKLNGAPPYIVVSSLLPTLRPQQRPFVDKVNKLLIKQSTTDFPVLIRYDTIYVGEVPTVVPTATPTATSPFGVTSKRAGLTVAGNQGLPLNRLLTPSPVPTPSVTPHPKLIDPVISMDGLHPNSLGYDVITSKLVKALSSDVRLRMATFTRKLGVLPTVVKATATPEPTVLPPDFTPEPTPTEDFLNW